MKADVELDVLFAPYAVTVEGLTNRQSLTLGSRRTLFIGQGESTWFRPRRILPFSSSLDSSLPPSTPRQLLACNVASGSVLAQDGIAGNKSSGEQ